MTDVMRGYRSTFVFYMMRKGKMEVISKRRLALVALLLSCSSIILRDCPMLNRMHFAKTTVLFSETVIEARGRFGNYSFGSSIYGYPFLQGLTEDINWTVKLLQF